MDGSSQLQFGLIQAQALINYPTSHLLPWIYPMSAQGMNTTQANVTICEC